MNTKAPKLFSYTVAILLVIQSLILYLNHGAVRAQTAQDQQAEQSPTPPPDQQPTAVPTPDDQSPTVSPTPEETPGTTESPTPEATPETTVTPSDQNQGTSNSNDTSSNSTTDNSSNSQNQNAGTTASPTESQSPTPTSTQEDQKGTLSAVVLKAIGPTPSINLDYHDTATSASLTTDKKDYSPTATVIVTGSNFNPGETYLLGISSTDPPPVNFETNLKADEKGTFLYSYTLDGNYRPNYKAEAKNKDGKVVATTTFTDQKATAPVPAPLFWVEEDTTQVKIDWKTVNGVDGYKVYVDTDPGFGSPNKIFQGNASSTTDNVAPNSTHYYKVTSFKGDHETDRSAIAPKFAGTMDIVIDDDADGADFNSSGTVSKSGGWDVFSVNVGGFPDILQNAMGGDDYSTKNPAAGQIFQWKTNDVLNGDYDVFVQYVCDPAREVAHYKIFNGSTQI